MWSLACVIILIAGVGALIWGWAFLRRHEPEPEAPASDPMLAVGVTASQKAVGKYLLVVMALFVVLVFLGGLTAHHTIEVKGFSGIDLSTSDERRVGNVCVISCRSQCSPYH